jgi:DNA repair exonuclease SbcCD nuclease subunit
MRFLFFTDTHIRGTTPRNRTDNFYNTLKVKFEEIRQMVLEKNIDYILHGGDWFDRPDISPAIVREFAIIIKNMGKPIYAIAGNHDIYGQNPETLGRTMLGILDGINLINLLGYDDIVILEKDGVRVQLTGQSYNYDIDGEDFRRYYIIKKGEDIDCAINIIHGMLLEKPFFEGIRYVLIDDIKDTEADITLVGHYHSGFGVKRLGNKYFVNPGSLTRVTNAISEIKRMPKVAIIDVEKGKISIEEVELKSALPGEEVLDRSMLEISQDRNMKLHLFYKGITAAGEFARIDINSIIEEIASNNVLSHEVKEEAIRRIATARENLAAGSEEE